MSLSVRGHRSSARGLMLVVAAATALVLTGCVPDAPEPSPDPVPQGPNPSASATPEPPEPSEDPAETPSPGATPFTIACDRLVSLQTMYDFNPNFGLLGTFSPNAGTPAADAAHDQGTACRWVNETSGDTVDVTVSIPARDDLSARRAAASGGVAIGGVADAWFSTAGGVGAVRGVAGEFWVTVSSVYFGAAEETEGIVRDVFAAID